MKRIVYFTLFLLLAAPSVFSQGYLSDSVHYSSADSIHFGATFTHPARAGRCPVVVIVSGTGMQDRDGTFYNEHRPFRHIADFLSQRGWAVLRTDDRETGETTGKYEDATTRDFANDVLAAINYLKSRDDVDTSRIGLVGHSEGGTITLMLGAECPDVKFIVSLAGVGVDGLEILKLQNEAILRSDKRVNQSLVEDYMNLYVPLFESVRNTPSDQPLDSALTKTFGEWKSHQTPEKLKAMNFINGRDQMFLSRYIRSASTPWYRYMIRYNPADYIPRIKIPVLAMNGDKDIMVPAPENLASIESLLKQGGNKNYKIVVMPGHNHMFQHCTECTQEEVSTLEEDISTQTLEVMYEWLSSLGN